MKLRMFCCKRGAKTLTLKLILLVITIAICVKFYSKRKSVPHPQTFHNGSRQACIHPKLPLWTDTIRIGGHYGKCEPIVCGKEENWVYTAGGRFYISPTATQLHGDIICQCVPIVNDHDERKVLKKIVPMLNGSLLVSDAFSVFCKGRDGIMYANVHACIAPISGERQQISDSVNKNKRERFNVLIFGFDSLSRMAVQRLLPRTHRYFTHTLGGVVLEGYNIVGDGTPQALLPILTGKQETEIPEVRRGKSNAVHVDEAVEFIWTKFEKHGYITQWGEDMANIGTFNMRMTGFKNQPVNHYMRPFDLEATFAMPHFQRFCLGSKPLHKVFIDWLKEGIDAYKNGPFFTFGFFSRYSHNNNDCVSLADDDVVNFFKYLETVHLFENTFLFLMSDHGLRIGPMRETEQGKLEERMPYFGISVPGKFKRKFPLKYRNLVRNANRLTSPFDVYHTLIDILEEKTIDKTYFDRDYFSLFSSIPRNRSCASAGIEAHWCACLIWKNVSVSNTYVNLSVRVTLDTFNSLLKKYYSLCHKLRLKHVNHAIMLETNNDVLKFKKSRDNDGRIADLSDKLKTQTVYYQISIETTPGDGVFEGTSARDVTSGKITVDIKDVSRINRYGDAPKCIEKIDPVLRPYCVCKT